MILEAEKGTYLTGLPDESKNMEQHTLATALLRDCVNNIENQFVNVLVNHENDFMAAYRGHMVKVKKELEFLKNKA